MAPTPKVLPVINAYVTAGTTVTWGAFNFSGVSDLEIDYGSLSTVRVVSNLSQVFTYGDTFPVERVYAGTRSTPGVSFSGFHPWVDEGSIGQTHLLTVQTSMQNFTANAVLIEARRSGSVNDVWRWSVKLQITR